MQGILDRIDSPADLTPLSYEEMDILAGEIRRRIIDTVKKNGGHMASNLGVVELTLALHRVLDSPHDKIVWDTSNQCYTHKLITGRRDAFDKIRTRGGLSGFAEITESPHDVFGAGHAGTGVSAALGVATGLTLTHQGGYVIGILGDGALTAGLSYEGLNNIAQEKPNNLMVILNDNGMSISENVGWLTHWRNRITLHPDYRTLVEGGRTLAKALPQGELVWRMAKRVKDSLEGLIIPNMIWEEMGFRYVGPIDGHNISELESVIRDAMKYHDKPPMIHVITHKGRGYRPAENDPVKYHQPGSPLGPGSGAPTYSKVFADTMERLMQANVAVVGISAAMLDGTGLTQVKKRFPKRVFDVGVAEQHAVTVAAGMARGGLRPVVAIYSTFLQRSFDQLLHDVCLQNLPVVIGVDRAGLVGEDGRTHQGIFDIAFLCCLPNMVMAAPKDENELQHLLYTAIQREGPMAIRYPRGVGYGVDLDPKLKALPIGKGERLREGKDLVLVALGSMVYPALEAAESLAGEGVECTVLNARFVKPLDRKLILDNISRTGLALTIEEHLLVGGFGQAVVGLVEEAMPKGAKVKTLGVPDRFVEHGPRSELLASLDLDADGIVRRVREGFPELFSTTPSSKEMAKTASDRS
ncbi:MAG: 1-deoxy-D-xylulose-5-phosphate synthase [Chloroflexi bacterium]|nr:1-deoxy-D-xylulose-5-phosphate synthase [Chloroflexota bacterium]